MTTSRLSCPKTSASSAVSAVNTSPQFRPGVLVRTNQLSQLFRQLQVLRIAYRAVDHHHGVIGHRLLEGGNPGLVLSLLRYGWNGVRPEAATCPKAGM